jgi:hypothetical protein
MAGQRILGNSVIVAMIVACAMPAAWADRGSEGGRRPEVDQRFRYDRHFPPRGGIVEALPPGHHAIPFRREGTYYYHSGVWYRPAGPRFVVVMPPVGIMVPWLPPLYTTVWVGSVPYYYAGGVYYVYRPEDRAYVVTEPPLESQVTVAGARPDDLFIYPKNNQDETRQATDRYECHRWGAGQTGFDPTQPGGKVAESDFAAKRADYRRAMTACLEGRGYSVK